MSEGVLIANRGEIAVRIARTIREIGDMPISVYSEADRMSLHVILSDMAFYLGTSEPENSYLNMDRIIQVAIESGAKYVHPGYGFLAENHEFARKVEEAGLKFVGPPWEVLELIGDKIRARETAKKAGVPVLPGSGTLKEPKEAIKEAKKIGFPVLIKAAMGGGGKGMRVVRREEDFESAFKLAHDEALASFGDGSLFIEKYLERPRHIEVQIIADGKGNVLPLHERECSIQRRHQKIIEESPSFVIDDKKRKEMMEAACAIAREVGYINAGTVEFLFDGERFYFLEVNARIQVEHPVTEMRFGIDLVREQMRVAKGGNVLHLKDIRPKGHAIEARIYAEDPENNFFPSPGKILWVREPGGPYLRVDSGIYTGYEVPVFYDPLLSKVIAWGNTRDEAIERLYHALGEYKIVGITTNISFHRALLKNEEFLNGEFDVKFLSRFSFRSKVEPFPLAVVGLIVSAEESVTEEKGEVDKGEQIGRISMWKYFGRREALRGADWELI